ncbi:alpha/beta fold hydrolase [Brevibacillus fluminis]|uniref:Alpha/beta fold hydrolase n=1 Tax=Brevibacillus fluminis TaxID=511487 RepID=A0A3M8DGL2_9BACL|nr:alpha/beta fold hydrolase [Brevibacillus fluminis]RNB87138.1 alpha/beta fold hydrolase [Brevibacillus fluminis]
MYAKINNTKIYFDVEGVGSVPDGPIMRQKPVCFVLHGGPGSNHTGYKPHLTPLSEHMQLVYIDNRGSGFSDEGPQSTYSLENNVEDVEALREYLGLEKIVILGTSYGGIVAQSYGVKYPDRLQGLLLMVTTPSYRTIEKAKKILAEKGTEEQKIVGEKIFSGTFTSEEEFVKGIQVMDPLYIYTYTAPSEEDKRTMEDALKRSKHSYQALNEGFRTFMKTYDVIDQLPRIKVPTLIIAGRHDWITPVEESVEISKGIPDNEFIIFENSSHDIIIDEYDLYIKTVTSFVQRRLLGRENA